MCFSNLNSEYSCINAFRMPMKSWLMGVCSNSPTKRKLHDVCQPEDACHLLKEEDRPRKADIEKMCSKGYFTKYATQSIYNEEHTYEYIGDFQQKGYSFKFSFSVRLSWHIHTHFTHLKAAFSCHVPVHRPRCVVMPPLIHKFRENQINKFGETIHNKMWFTLIACSYRSMV